MDSIVYLGTSKDYCTANTYPTSKLLRLKNGDQYLINVPEGTQLRLTESGLGKPGRIKKIFITDLDNDKIGGLPGLLCSLGAAHRKEDGEDAPVNKKKKCDLADIELYGPFGLAIFIRTILKISTSMLGYTYKVFEFPCESKLTSSLHDLDTIDKPCLMPTGDFTSENDFHLQEMEPEIIFFDKNLQGFLLFKNFKIDKDTKLSCYAFIENSIINYIFGNNPKIGKLDAKKLKSDGLKPGKDYTLIKAGKTVVNDEGKIFNPKDYISENIPGNLLICLQSFEQNDNILIKNLYKNKDYQQNSTYFTVNIEFMEKSRKFLENFESDVRHLDVIYDYLNLDYESCEGVNTCEFSLIWPLVQKS